LSVLAVIALGFVSIAYGGTVTQTHPILGWTLIVWGFGLWLFILGKCLAGLFGRGQQM
jgi:tellurite resistance protein TehA-like permease